MTSHISSLKVTATGAVKSTPGWVYGFVIASGTSPTITLSDGNGGTDLMGGSGTTAIVILPHPIRFGSSIYATVGGTSPVVYVLYT